MGPVLPHALAGVCPPGPAGYVRGMRIGTIDVDKLRGVSDKAVGLAIEATGVLVGNGRLQERGEAMQDRATETLKALRAEARAEGERGKAQALSSQTGTDLGVLDGVKGRVKEAAGKVVDDAGMQREGRAERRKGDAQAKAVEAEAEAEAHEAKAEAADVKVDATRG